MTVSKNLQDSTRIEIDKAAVLSSLVYKDIDIWEHDSLNKQVNGLSADVGRLEVIATSKDLKIDEKKLVAFALQDTETGDIFIVYRGTGKGKWIDNAIGMFEDSPIQEEAVEFYNKVVESRIVNKSDFSGRLIVTGHSKGGNLAQYVTMQSKYGNLIDNCYSIDGQGFSNEAYERFSQMSDYSDRINKMYSINGQNDYVDPLGKVIIPEDRTFFVKNVELTSGDIFTHFHAIDGIMNQGGLNWDYTEENGKRVYNYNLEAGPVNKLVKELSANMMSLNDEELEDCAITIMFLLESTIGDVNEVADGYRNSITFEEGIGFINVGLPLIINTVRNSENTNAVFEALGLDITKDHWLVDPLCDIAIELSENMTIDELEGYVSLFKEVSDYASSKNLSLGQLIDYLMEDPIRLIDLYTSLDLSKKVVNSAVLKTLSAGIVGKLLLTAVFPSAAVMIDFAAAAGIVYLVANHIEKNWDTICNNVKLAAEYVKDEIVEFYNEAKHAVEVGINNWVSSVCKNAEKYISRGERVVNKLIDGATNFWEFFKDQTIKAAKMHLLVSNPLLYIVASKVYKAVAHPVKINVYEISDCVDRMNRLAKRVAKIDQRLDNLYWRLAQNNIEQEEGLFTSLANIYNLFRADLNVDEGAAIKRKARALTDLYDGYKRTDKWVLEHVPKKI